MARGCVSSSWAFVVRLAGAAAGLLARGDVRRALCYLRPAEAWTRRLLVLMAAELAATLKTRPERPLRAAGPRSAPPAPGSPGSRAPAFRITDPIRILVLRPPARVRGLPVPPPARAGVAARLEALRAVLDDPAPHVRRVALFLARARARRSGRAFPVSQRRPPPPPPLPDGTRPPDGAGLHHEAWVRLAALWGVP